MTDKRSIGVTIFGVLTIIMALACLPFMFDAKSAIEPFIEPYGLILYITSFPLFIFEIVLGINILRLKEWARKYLVILTAVYIVTMFIIPQLEDRNFEKNQLKVVTNLYRSGPINTGYIIYPINTTVGELIFMRVDYDLPSKAIANVGFHLSKHKPDGEYKYEIKSKEGESIKVDFLFANGELGNVRLAATYQPLPENRQLDTILTAVSDDNKEILFSFLWNDDGSIRNVNVRPAVNEETVQESWKKRNLTPEQTERMSATMENLHVLVVQLAKIIFYGVFLLFYILTVFFFTRPKVKAQFK